MADPTYSRDEIKQILRRAAARQQAAPPEETEDGLTLEEIRHLAAEAGLDVRHIDAAAAEVERTDGEAPGATAEAKATVPGHVGPEEWQAMVRAIEQAYTVAGEAQQVGDLFEWTQRDDPAGEQRVTVQNRDGQVHILVHSGQQRTAFLPVLLVGLVVAAGVFFIIDALLPALAFGGGILALAYVIARSFKAYVRRFQDRKARDLAQRLQRLVAAPGVGEPEATATRTSAPAERASTPPLELPGAEPPVSDTEPPQRDRTT